MMQSWEVKYLNGRVARVNAERFDSRLKCLVNGQGRAAKIVCGANEVESVTLFGKPVEVESEDDGF